MMKGVTASGFEFEIDEAYVADDWETLELLGQIEAGEVWRLPQLTVRMLGEEQAKQLKDYLRDENGKVGTKAMTADVLSIFTSVKAGKN